MSYSHTILVGALAAVGLSPSVFAQQSKVIPKANATVEGTRYSVYPFGYTHQRAQQVWVGSAVTTSTALISGVNYRANAPRTNPMPGRTYTTLNIKLGTTKASPTSMSTTFATNITSTMTTVFNKAYSLPTQVVISTSPSAFNISFGWTTPLFFSSANGNLLMDVTLPGAIGKSNYFVDAEVSKGGSAGTVAPFGTSGSFSSPELFKMKADAQTLVPGGRLSILCGSFRQGYLGSLMFSLSNKMWGAIPLPLDLALIGAPKNNLYVGMDIVLPFPATSNGASYSSSFQSPIPTQAPYFGLTFYTQAYYIDAKANAAGLVSTHGLALTIASSKRPVTNQLGHYNSNSVTGNFAFGSSLFGGPVIKFQGILP